MLLIQDGVGLPVEKQSRRSFEGSGWSYKVALHNVKTELKGRCHQEKEMHSQRNPRRNQESTRLKLSIKIV